MTYSPSPPTHEGELLVQRKALIQKYFHSFFKGNRLLDVGCCRGEFLKIGTFKEKIGLDVRNYGQRVSGSQHYITSFRDYYSAKQFDKIFVGNVGHYLFLDCDGWECISKLAALSCGDILVEGPKNTECADTYNLIPKDLHVKFNTFLTEMNKYFDLVKTVPTISYTPGRFFMLFRKKAPKMVDNFVEKKLGCNWYRHNPNHVTIELASYSPISNGFCGFTATGWREPKIRATPYHYRENETTLLKLICKQGIFLAKNGYIDIDSATLNFMRSSNLYFDKGGVRPIKRLVSVSFDIFSDLFYQSYNRYKIPEVLEQAFTSRDSYAMEKAWQQWKTIIS